MSTTLRFLAPAARHAGRCVFRRGLVDSVAGASQYRAVDVHTHCYLPRYMQLLRDRREVPRVVDVEGQSRLIILPGEDEEVSTSSGRPIGREYYDMASKLSFMDRHGIEVSVLSLANPWIDFLAPGEAAPMARELNDEMQSICDDSRGRLYGFGVLPVQDPAASAAELERLAGMSRMRGVILGTAGCGRGLDDPALDPVWRACEARGLVVFVHPHYGVGREHYHGTGHALFLALGFPFETTVAVSRLILGGALDRFPDLKLLLAHSGGTLPFLAGRLDSCVKHDQEMAGKLKHPPSHYLKRMYFDSIQYQTPSLACVQQLVGADRLMFGTDHPFFPPPGGKDPETHVWPSTEENLHILGRHFGADDERGVLRENAYRILGITPP